MTKQEKQEIRDKLILENARMIVKKDGIIEFKMSEIAKASKISIGTLYIHFISKEDVLLALACQNIIEVKAFFQEIVKLECSNKEKLLAFTFTSHIRRSKESYISELEQLVTNTSIRNRASKYKTQEHDSLIQEALLLVKSVLIEAIKEDSPQTQNTELLCDNLLFGLWSLSLGCLSILELNIFKKHDLDINNPLIVNASYLINSYLKQKPINHKNINHIIEETKNLIKKGIQC